MSFYVIKNHGFVGNISSEVARHEEYPYVSEFWHNILLRWSIQQWENIKSLKHVVARDTWKFFHHSEIFPAWNDSNGQPGLWESVEDILKLHMNQCNKSAVILNNADAIQLHTILSMHKKAVFFGKDLIYENLQGYIYSGLFPNKLIWKSKYYFQTGILNWWQTYFKWCIFIKTKTEEMKLALERQQNNDVSDTDPNSATVYVIACIEMFELLLSIFAFIVIDLKLLKHCYEFAIYFQNRVTKMFANFKFCIF